MTGDQVGRQADDQLPAYGYDDHGRELHPRTLVALLLVAPWLIAVAPGGGVPAGVATLLAFAGAGQLAHLRPRALREVLPRRRAGGR